MDEIVFVSFVKNISMFASIVGILAGLDLLFGARIIAVLQNALDKATGISVDKAIVNPKVRAGLGTLFLILSVLMILLIRIV